MLKTLEDYENLGIRSSKVDKSLENKVSSFIKKHIDDESFMKLSNDEQHKMALKEFGINKKKEINKKRKTIK